MRKYSDDRQKQNRIGRIMPLLGFILAVLLLTGCGEKSADIVRQSTEAEDKAQQTPNPAATVSGSS